MKYQPNKIKVDFGSYRHYWRGTPKVGKTTMFRDVVKEEYGDTKFGFLISTGNETGYKALDDIYAHEAPTWKEFVNTINDLVKNKSDNEFKSVAIDTVDELVSIAIQEALDLHKARTGKTAKSINEALGGFGAGKRYVIKIINDQIARLDRSGYGLVFIGHTKLRDVREKGESEAYQILTSNLETDYNAIFSNKADIVATFVTDKVIEDHKITEKNRFIIFRDDGYIDAGSRLSGIPERVPMTAKNYLSAFEEGIRSSKNTFATDEDIENMRKEEIEARNKNAEKYIQSEDSDDKSEDLLTEAEEDFLIPMDELRPMLNKRCSELGGTRNQLLMTTLEQFAEGGNFNKIKDIKLLNDLWEAVRTLN